MYLQVHLYHDHQWDRNTEIQVHQITHQGPKVLLNFHLFYAGVAWKASFPTAEPQ